jgi:predicted dehydrogenase
MQSVSALGLSALTYRRASAAPNDRVHLAVLGLGLRGSYLAQTLQKMGGCDVVALCDVDRRRLATANKTSPAALSETDLRRLLDKASKYTDAVVIATPTHSNVVAAVRACKLGKHVYVETPVSHNVVESAVLQRTAHECRCLVQAGTQLRSDKQLNEMKAALPALGSVSVVRIIVHVPRPRLVKRENEPVPEGVDYDLWLGPAPERAFNRSRFHSTWRWFWDYGTGLLGDEGVPYLDLACWLLDLRLAKTIRLSSSGGKFDSEHAGDAPDTQIATFELEAVNVVYEHRAWLQPGRRPTFGISLHGEKGTLFVDDAGWRVADDLLARETPDRPQVSGAPQPPAHQRFRGLFDARPHLQDFLDCIRSGKRPTGDIQATYPGLLLCHLGNIAWRIAWQRRGGKNQEFLFDTSVSRFVDNAEADSLLTREYRKPFALGG